MTSRRSVLCVPASESAKVAKALAFNVDEVVIDLEDAVAPSHKDSARAILSTVRPRTRGSVAVRVNCPGSAWILADLAAVAENPAITSIVLPKVDSADNITSTDRELARLELANGRATPVSIQALIESAAGLGEVRTIAAASPRMTSLVLGYADLGASLGRRPEASWQGVQDAVILAARIAGIQALDGPQLTVHADSALALSSGTAEALGFDGKWVIHPRQADMVQSAFTPNAEDVEDARSLLAAMETATSEGRGTIEWQGRMLDEAVAVQARRVLSRVVV